MRRFFEAFAAENVPSAFFPFDYHWKMDAYGLSIPSCDVPFVRVSQMFQDKLRNIDILFSLCSLCPKSFCAEA